MCPRVSLRSSLRITLVLFIGIALLPAPCVSILVSAVGQGRGHPSNIQTDLAQFSSVHGTCD